MGTDLTHICPAQLEPLRNDIEMWCGLEPVPPLQEDWLSFGLWTVQVASLGTSVERDEGGVWGLWETEGDSEKWREDANKASCLLLRGQGADSDDDDGRPAVSLSPCVAALGLGPGLGWRRETLDSQGS